MQCGVNARYLARAHSAVVVIPIDKAPPTVLYCSEFIFVVCMNGATLREQGIK